MRSRVEVVAWAVVMALACGGGAPRAGTEAPQAASAAGRRPSISGRVETTGLEPATAVVVRLADGEVVRVAGPLTDEIGRLVGATVAVFGELQPGPMGRAVTVETYELLAVDGQRPYVGVVQAADGDVWLKDGRELRLTGAAATLRQLVGAKIYVLGTLVGDTVVVASFGVIRPAP